MNKPQFSTIRGGRAGFTMVELALCIAIVAFSMVAILGVLPLGLNVQKQNKEETIIEQEGPVWIEMIRRGGIGWDDVTNYVDLVVVEKTPLEAASKTDQYGFRGPFYSMDNPVPNPGILLRSTSEVMSLLSIPMFEADRGTVFSNKITAIVRSFSGSLNTQIRPDSNPGFKPDDRQLEDAFRYQLQVELTPATQLPVQSVDSLDSFRSGVFLGGYLNAIRMDPSLSASALRNPEELKNASLDRLAATVYDIKLIFRWPVFKVGNDISVGANKKVFRGQILGKPRFAINNPSNTNAVYWPGTSLRPRRFDGGVLNHDLTR